MNPTDMFYHKKSLILARMFRDLYHKHGADNELVVAIREKYIEARRQVSFDESTGERHGSYEAFLATQ